MPIYVVPTDGDPALAAGRLALFGVQSIANFRPRGRTSARLYADSADAARQRVGVALGEGFRVGTASPDAGELRTRTEGPPG